MIRLSTILLAFSIGACAGSHSGENLSTQSFDSTVTALAKDPKFLLLDIRTPQEYATGHLPGSRLVDFYSPGFTRELDKLPRDSEVLLYCRSGNRTGQTVRIMKEMGFKNVRHMAGGLNSWKAEARPVVN
jgi:rhodanese-related sulfurtransferase